MSGDEFFRQPEPKPMNKYEVLDRDLARINTQIYSLNSTRGSMSPKAGMYREQELERLHNLRTT